MLFWLLALACFGDKAPVGTPDTGDTGKFENIYPEASDCEELLLDVEGTTYSVEGDTWSAMVGDTWIVWMRCDGALLLGTIHMRFEPPTVANVDENTALFVETGDATLTYQVGSFRLEQAVSVAE